jgi:hypothetical protein
MAIERIRTTYELPGYQRQELAGACVSHSRQVSHTIQHLVKILQALAGLAADRTIQRDTRDNKPFGLKSTIDMKLVGQGSHDRNGSS